MHCDGGEEENINVERRREKEAKREKYRSHGGCGRYNDITGMVAWEVHNSRAIITA